MSKKHAEFPPSSAQRWLNCLLAAVKERKCPNPSNPKADTGTYAHKLSEEEIRGIRKDPIPQDMKEYLYIYIDYIKMLKQDDWNVELEKKVFIDIIDNCFGTADCVAYKNNCLKVIDLKTGLEPVYAVENHQLILYAIGYLSGLNETVKVKIDTIELIICQPRLKVPFSHYEMTKDNLRIKAEEIKAIGKQIKEAKRGLRESTSTQGSHCKWCRVSDCEHNRFYFNPTIFD
jgi:hypothetical protein